MKTLFKVILLVGVLLLPFKGWAADTKISAMTSKAAPVAADIIPILDSQAANANKQTTLGVIPAGLVTNANDAGNYDVFPLWSKTQGGAYAVYSTTGLTYHPSTGVLTAAGFSGPLVGNVTGVASGNLVSGGALGTPSSGTLSGCSGLLVSGITASTSTALGVGSIELGHASDTTIARSAAGVVTVEGAKVKCLRTGTIASSATPYPSSDGTVSGTKVNFFTITALAAAAQLQIPCGTPDAGDELVVRITGDATPRALTYVTTAGGYRAGDTTPGALPTTTVASKTLYLKFIYNGDAGFWDFIGIANNF